MKKIICLLLAILSLLLVACNQNDNNNDDDRPNVPNRDGEYDENGYLNDDLPELDYNDEPVTVLYWEDNFHDEFEITESSDDMLKNAVYYRNVTTEERLGIKFNYVSTPGWETAPFVAFVKRDVQSGSNEYDIV